MAPGLYRRRRHRAGTAFSDDVSAGLAHFGQWLGSCSPKNPEDSKPAPRAIAQNRSGATATRIVRCICGLHGGATMPLKDSPPPNRARHGRRSTVAFYIPVAAAVSARAAAHSGVRGSMRALLRSQRRVRYPSGASEAPKPGADFLGGVCVARLETERRKCTSC